MDKKEVRKQIRSIRDAMGETERLCLSERITDTLLALPEYIESEYVLVYVSFGSEVDTRDIILDALKNNKKVGVPRIDAGDMNFYEINGFEELIPGFYGIYEPDASHKKPCEPESALMILPGLAFDRKMFRAGYGGGYYDRYFSVHSGKKYLKYALAFDCQVLKKGFISCEPNDVPVDCIITEFDVIRSL